MPRNKPIRVSFTPPILPGERMRKKKPVTGVVDRRSITSGQPADFDALMGDDFIKDVVVKVDGTGEKYRMPTYALKRPDQPST